MDIGDELMLQRGGEEMREPCHVAIFLPSLRGGGAEKAAVNLSKGFSAKGLKVDLVLAKSEGPFLKQVPESVRIVNLKSSRILTSFFPMISYLRSRKPEILISSMNHANVVAVLASKMSRANPRTYSVVHNQNLSLLKPGSNILPFKLVADALMNIAYRKAFGVVAVSKGVASAFAGATRIPLDRIHVIPNPIDTDDIAVRNLSAPNHPWFKKMRHIPVVIGVGRLEKVKDFPTLMRAFSKIIKKGCRARLVIAGEGSERSDLESLAESLGLGPYVSLPGFVQNPFAYMKRASVLVVSSLSESFGNVLVEAMACGTPVISTDCDYGPRETLDGGRYGPLVPVGDVNSLSDAIQKILCERPDRRALMQRAAEYSVENVTERFLEVMDMN
jgi:glycosyltransferase involved in cell wall biosynthesis